METNAFDAKVRLASSPATAIGCGGAHTGLTTATEL